MVDVMSLFVMRCHVTSRSCRSQTAACHCHVTVVSCHGVSCGATSRHVKSCTACLCHAAFRHALAGFVVARMCGALHVLQNMHHLRERCMCCKYAPSKMHVALRRCVFECCVVICLTRQTMLPFLCSLEWARLCHVKAAWFHPMRCHHTSVD